MGGGVRRRDAGRDVLDEDRIAREIVGVDVDLARVEGVDVARERDDVRRASERLRPAQRRAV